MHIRFKMEIYKIVLVSISVVALSCTASAVQFSDNDDYYDSAETVLESCDRSKCKLPDCSCFGTDPPKGYAHKDRPQFVMLTFDDAMTVGNVETYRTISNNRKNKGNNCSIAMTFFVCHEYNDYTITNEMYTKGHEIAVHSITHESNTDMWKTSSLERWKNEMEGMREILRTFAGIPTHFLGHRAPFLQTAGDTTFRMLKDSTFLYDSSLPTRAYMKPPIYPYTLDYGYLQDCQIRPCPKSSFPGLWVVPMVQYERTALNQVTKRNMTFHCSMTDACTPYPETATDTRNYLMENFLRHYTENKAPFPLFLHEAWLKNGQRLKGYLEFLDEILQKDDVFVVTIGEVINYMQNPVSLEEYKTKRCFMKNRRSAIDCSHPKVCNFPKVNRIMKSCVPCPRRYPWLGNPYGNVIKST